MKAAFLTGIEQVEVRDVAAPPPAGQGQVKIRVETVGVCGSDMHYYRIGRIGDQVVQFPWTIGHECAGTVVEAGSGVKNVKPGDRVAVDPLFVCGRCDQCRSGREHTCRSQAFLGCPGQAPGALAEYIVVQGRSCYPVPETVSAVQAAMIEPFSIGLYAQRLAGGVAGRTCAVLGTGPIGLSVVAALKAAGAANIYVTDIRDNRAQLAARLGADWTGNPVRQDVVEAILTAEPLGVDFAFECAGEQDAVDQCAQVAKPGATILLVGIPEAERYGFEMNAMRRKELTVRNVRRQNGCVGAAIELVAGGRVNLDPLVTHHFTMEQTAEAFDTVAYYRDNVVKAVIDVA